MYVELKNISKTIKGTEVLHDINYRFEGGKIYGLKGKNGSGKTMLMRVICGLIVPSDGMVDINGEILGKEISFPRSIGVLIESPAFISNYTGMKNLQVLASIQNRIGVGEIRKALEEIGLEPDDKRTYRKYSLGMKQRLGIAAAVMEEPEMPLPANIADVIRSAIPFLHRCVGRFTPLLFMLTFLPLVYFLHDC